MSIPDKEISKNNFLQEASPLRKILVAALAFPLILILNLVFVISVNQFMKFDIIAAVFIMVVSEVLVVILALSATNETSRWKESLYLKNLNVKNVVIGLSTGIIFLTAQQLVSTIVILLGVSLTSSKTSTALGEITGQAKPIMLFFVIPFLVPFIEELFFRGLIFGQIKDSGIENKKRALIFGAIFSSIIFGLAHGQGFDASGISVLLTTGTLGLVNCWLIYKTESLYTAYASHLSYNLATSGLIFLASLAHQ